MARRSFGHRWAPATEAVSQGYARGQSPTAALADYRRSGGSIRTQEWYRLWRRVGEVPAQLRPPVGTPPTLEVPGREARDWITRVRIVYFVPGEKGKPSRITSWWYEQYSGGPQRMSNMEAIEGAIAAGNELEKKYEWVPIDGYVVSYEALY